MLFLKFLENFPRRNQINRILDRGLNVSVYLAFFSTILHITGYIIFYLIKLDLICRYSLYVENLICRYNNKINCVPFKVGFAKDKVHMGHQEQDGNFLP